MGVCVCSRVSVYTIFMQKALELKLHVVVSLPRCVLGAEPMYSTKAASVLNH